MQSRAFSSGSKHATTCNRRRCRHVTRAATALPQQFKAVKPVGDRVFVKVEQAEARTQGGVLLPTSAQKKPTAGAIVAAGDVEIVKLGDRVVYSKYAGTEVEVAGEDHILLKEDDCIGILPSDDKIANLKPLGDRVLIKCAKVETQTASGLLLTSESADKPTFGEVVSVGEGKKDDSGNVTKPNLQAGTTVMYSKYSGTEFEDADDTAYIVVREGDILAALG